MFEQLYFNLVLLVLEKMLANDPFQSKIVNSKHRKTILSSGVDGKSHTSVKDVSQGTKSEIKEGILSAY